MSENPEPPRMRLADMWPEEGPGSLSERPADVPPKIGKPAVARLTCELCGGDVLRSRVRIFERPWVMWSKRRPYRCMECGVRHWRPESK